MKFSRRISGWKNSIPYVWRLDVDVRKIIKNHMLELILLGLVILLSFTAPGFFSRRNFFNILQNSSLQGIIALGMTLVIISGEIDLSVGSVVAFSGCVTAWFTEAFISLGLSVPPAVILAMLIAVGSSFLIGSFTAFVRNRYNVPTFIITLALMTSLSGFANLITGGFHLTPFPQWFIYFGGGYIFGVPFPALLFIFVFVVINFITTSTTFGRSVYAIGGNMEAARLSGINIHRVKWLVLAVTNSLMAVSGIMVSSRIMSGSSTAAKGWELDVISAVIIGGTALNGGSGTVIGTLVGVLFLGVLVNGMTLLNISEYWQFVVRGILILGAVLINSIQAQRAARPVTE
jgi:ribose/xylose/arabinose/galactoside ABC-type transport system permease subunit